MRDRDRGGKGRRRGDIERKVEIIRECNGERGDRSSER